MPIVIESGYPLVEDVMQLARSHVNDTFPGLTDTPGEGQILTDDPVVSPFTLPFIKSAIRKVYRALGNAGVPTLIKDNVLVGPLAVVHGTVGVGIPDPAVQTNLGFTGYFDGTAVDALKVLPLDVLAVDKVWERLYGSSDAFLPLEQATEGMTSRNQAEALRTWEWRGDAIWFPGALTEREIRLRYHAALPNVDINSDFSLVAIPILDSTDVLAYLIAEMYAAARGAANVTVLTAHAQEELQQIKNRQIRRNQGVTYFRPSYGS